MNCSLDCSNFVHVLRSQIGSRNDNDLGFVQKIFILLFMFLGVAFVPKKKNPKIFFTN